MRQVSMRQGGTRVVVALLAVAVALLLLGVIIRALFWLVIIAAVLAGVAYLAGRGRNSRR